jgi:hypothetical protein
MRETIPSTGVESVPQPALHYQIPDPGLIRSAWHSRFKDLDTSRDSVHIRRFASSRPENVGLASSVGDYRHHQRMRARHRYRSFEWTFGWVIVPFAERS